MTRRLGIEGMQGDHSVVARLPPRQPIVRIEISPMSIGVYVYVQMVNSKLLKDEQKRKKIYLHDGFPYFEIIYVYISKHLLRLNIFLLLIGIKKR